MKLVTTKLYSFNELSEKAKQTAINDFLDNYQYDSDHVHDECKASLEAFCNLFEASFNYNVGAHSYSCVTISSNLDDSVLALEGKRLYAWVVNNTDFLDRKNRLFSLENGLVRKCKTLFEEHTRMDDCCLTGVCYDIDLVKEFIDSVLKGCTLEQSLDYAASALCKAWQNSLEYYTTEEYAKEHLENDADEKFKINGTEF